MKNLTLIITALTFVSCNKIKNKAHETVNSGEEIITKTASKAEKQLEKQLQVL